MNAKSNGWNQIVHEVRRWTVVAVAASLLCCDLPAQQPANSSPDDSQNPGFTLKVNTDLVLTNVVVRDRKTGEVVKGLSQADFTILENGKPQNIQSFDYQSVEQATPLNEATISGQAANILLKNGTGGVASSEQLRNHRLIVLFFDLSSMQVEDLDRAVDSARDFIKAKMQPADLVALMSLGTSLSLDQDFTANKEALVRGVSRYNGSEGSGFAQGTDSSATNASEQGTGFTADETEYNDINTDRQLYALKTIAQSLEKINQKKSLLYFSGGLSRDGIENQASLRSTINSAVKANLSIYSVDTRGLQALSPLGDATKGSLTGTAAFTGSGVQANFDSNQATQETLSTLSTDTGGKAFFDSNDFAPAFQKVQQDTSAYYVIGFHSSNLVRDGKFRKLQIKLNRPDMKLEYRPGYYAPADFQHSGKEDRERELDEQLASDLPATDVALYLQALFFRVDETHYFVPISLIVPGSQIPFSKSGDRDKATLDIVGQVKDSHSTVIADARQTVKLSLDQNQQVSRKNIQYSTGFTLPIGKYHLKFVVRENETGHMGSFEADIVVPDQRKASIKLSSVVLASMKAPVTNGNTTNLMVRDGFEYVPNIPHVFRQSQKLYLLYELYDPAHASAQAAAPAEGAAKESKKTKAASSAPIKVLTNIQFLNGATKVFETPLVEADTINVPARDAVAFQFEVPLAGLTPGLYTCQVNVIDDAGGSFTFPRMAVLIKDSAGTPPPAGDAGK